MTPEYPGASRFVPADILNYRAYPAGRKIKRIVLHITDGGPQIGGTIAWFQNPQARVSAHYVIGQDGEVVQMVAHACTAWHAGKANADSIGIEHVANTRGLMPTAVQLDASAKLVTWLCDLFKLPVDRQHVLGHCEVDPAHPSCPNVDWDWPGYMARFLPDAPKSETA